MNYEFLEMTQRIEGKVSTAEYFLVELPIVYPSFISKYILFSLKQNFYVLNSKWSPDKVPID